MEDLTLQSELYNNLKFNMQKVLFEFPENDIAQLSRVFDAALPECESMLNGFQDAIVTMTAQITKEIPLPTVNKELTIAFVGDSLTSDRESYFNVIRYLFRNEKRLNLIDAAISGFKTDDVISRFFITILNHRPDITHILIGTNDLRTNDHTGGKPFISLTEMRKNLGYLISTLQNYGSRVVVSTIPPVSVTGIKRRFPDHHWTYNLEEIRDWNEIIAETTAKFGAGLNDMRPVYDGYKAEELLLKDGLHLNHLGQLLLAENVLSVIGSYF